MPRWHPEMSGQGQQIFTDALGRYAAQRADPELTALADATTAPLRIEVRGRRGVGVTSVAAALRAAGYRESAGAEVRLYVVAEVCKPEDRRALAAEPADVVVFNKADLVGLAPAGPMQRARRQAAALSAAIGVPTHALVAPVALAAADPARLDDELLAALRTLVTAPAPMISADAFVAAAHPLPTATRRRLVATLDLFGIAHAVVQLRDHPETPLAQLRTLFAAAGGLDELRSAVELAGAAARYRRMVALCQELELRAITDASTAEFLAGDDVVLGRMAAALEVVAVAGLPPADDAPLPTALRWRRYAAGPVSGLHRGCGLDIARGSLRLLERGTPR